MGVNEVSEDEIVMFYRKNKRIKGTELSDLPNRDSEVTKVSGSTSPCLSQRISSTSDQLVEFESVSPRCSERMSEKVSNTDHKISMEPVNITLQENAVICYSGFGKSTSNSDAKVQSDESNRNTIKDRNEAVMLVKENGDEFPKVVDDSCIQDPSLHVDNSQSDLLADDTSAKNVTLCDAQVHANKLSEENVQVHNVWCAEQNIDKLQKVSSNNVLHLDRDEQVEASSADPSPSQLGGVEVIPSEVINPCVNVGLDNILTGYMRKKLLVLDVNGLLVDINSYVPYDYDPDEIILRKAVFKRPYCDDFLKFCFERFNVGVWTSKTKRNMEPILDFLLGKDKSKLLFCWDQSHCTYTGYNTVEKRYKPLLLKKLKKLWDKREPDLPWERGSYNESNTVLLDDSPYKALRNPRYTGIFPHTYRFRDVKDNSIGPRGDLRAYLEGLAAAENVQDYLRQYPFGQRPIKEKNLSWGFYCKVIEASSSPPHATVNDDITWQETF